MALINAFCEWKPLADAAHLPPNPELRGTVHVHLPPNLDLGDEIHVQFLREVLKRHEITRRAGRAALLRRRISAQIAVDSWEESANGLVRSLQGFNAALSACSKALGSVSPTSE